MLNGNEDTFNNGLLRIIWIFSKFLSSYLNIQKIKISFKIKNYKDDLKF